jgi:hypothetical protein
MLPTNKSRYSKQEEKKRSFTMRRQYVWASAAAKNICILQANRSCRLRRRWRGGSSTLSVNPTFSEVRPSLGRQHGRRISAPKDDVSSPPGPSPRGAPQEPGPSRRLGRPPRSLSQLSPEDISPAHGLGNSTPALVPPVDGPARLRPMESSSRANSTSIHTDTAASGSGSSKSGRGFL